MTVEQKLKDLEEEFFLLSEEVAMLQQHSTRRVNGLKQRIAAKLEEVEGLWKEIKSLKGEKI